MFKTAVNRNIRQKLLELSQIVILDFYLIVNFLEFLYFQHKYRLDYILLDIRPRNWMYRVNPMSLSLRISIMILFWSMKFWFCHFEFSELSIQYRISF